MKNLFFSALIASCMIGGMATANENQTTWSLQDCFDHALSHNLEVNQQRLSENQAKNDLNQSYANLFPNLNTGSYQGFSYGRTVDRFTNEFATERVAYQDMFASSEVVLFSGFQNINNIRRHLARHTAFRYDTRQMENNLILSIASAYLQILYFEDRVEVASEQLEVIQQQVERTRILLEGGTVARGALLEIEAQAAQEEHNLVVAKNNLKLSYLELIHLLDLDPEQEFRIVRPELEVDEGFVFSLPQNVYEKALQVEPSVMAARERISMAEKNLAINRGEYSPRLSFAAHIGSGYSEAARRMIDVEGTGQYETIGYTESGEAVTREIMMPITKTTPYRDQISENFNRVIQLRLTIPVFNRLHVRNRVQNSRLELEKARKGFELSKNNLNKTIQQAHADAMAAYQKYLSTEKSKEAFAESYKYTEQRFNLGMVSSLEYNEAKARLARAEVDALQSKYEFIFQTKILEFYQGLGFKL